MITTSEIDISDYQSDVELIKSIKAQQQNLTLKKKSPSEIGLVNTRPLQTVFLPYQHKI